MTFEFGPSGYQQISHYESGFPHQMGLAVGMGKNFAGMGTAVSNLRRTCTICLLDF